MEGAIGVGGAEEVCPLKDFGKAELVEGDDDGADRALAADDEYFDGFTVGVGVAVELEGEFEVDLVGVGLPRTCGTVRGDDAGTVAGGRFGLHRTSTETMTSIIVNKLVAIN